MYYSTYDNQFALSDYSNIHPSLHSSAHPLHSNIHPSLLSSEAPPLGNNEFLNLNKSPPTQFGEISSFYGEDYCGIRSSPGLLNSSSNLKTSPNYRNSPNCDNSPDLAVNYSNYMENSLEYIENFPDHMHIGNSYNSMGNSLKYMEIPQNSIEDEKKMKNPFNGPYKQVVQPQLSERSTCSTNYLERKSDEYCRKTWSPPLLPPCRVCGEKASGFHYGVNTCEACKGFYRRSLTRKQDYKCFSQGTCQVLPGKRNFCASCRYQKCLAVGMSKNAIKTGRYTHEKRSKDIREVKKLQLKQKQISLKSSKNINDSQNGDADEDDNYQPYLDDSSDNYNEDCPAMKTTCKDLTDSGFDSAFTSLRDDDIDEQDYDEMVGKITRAYQQQTPHTKEFFDGLKHREEDYIQRRELQIQVFGSMKPISYEEYFKIYHATGMDIDGRKCMLEHMMPCIELAVKRFIAFAKVLPGFKKLHLEDQISLIKGSRFEVWFISAYRAFNTKYRIFTHVCGYTVHEEEMCRLYDAPFLQRVFKMADRLSSLKFDQEEECLFKAVIILSRDRSVLKDPDSVEAYQDKFLQILLKIHKKRMPQDRKFFQKLISVLVEFRTLTELHQEQESRIGTEWEDDIEIPPLLFEIFSV